MVGKPVTLFKVISVADPLLPLVSSASAPSKVVVAAPNMFPPHSDIPQPKAPNCSAGPTW